MEKDSELYLFVHSTYTVIIVILVFVFAIVSIKIQELSSADDGLLLFGEINTFHASGVPGLAWSYYDSSTDIDTDTAL